MTTALAPRCARGRARTRSTFLAACDNYLPFGRPMSVVAPVLGNSSDSAPRWAAGRWTCGEVSRDSEEGVVTAVHYYRSLSASARHDLVERVRSQRPFIERRSGEAFARGHVRAYINHNFADLYGHDSPSDRDLSRDSRTGYERYARNHADGSFGDYARRVEHPHRDERRDSGGGHQRPKYGDHPNRGRTSGSGGDRPRPPRHRHKYGGSDRSPDPPPPHHRTKYGGGDEHPHPHPHSRHHRPKYGGGSDTGSTPPIGHRHARTKYGRDGGGRSDTGTGGTPPRRR